MLLKKQASIRKDSSNFAHRYLFRHGPLSYQEPNVIYFNVLQCMYNAFYKAGRQRRIPNGNRYFNKINLKNKAKYAKQNATEGTSRFHSVLDKKRRRGWTYIFDFKYFWQLPSLHQRSYKSCICTDPVNVSALCHQARYTTGRPFEAQLKMNDQVLKFCGEWML